MKKESKKTAKKKATPVKAKSVSKKDLKTVSLKIDKEKFRSASKTVLKVLALILILMFVDFFVQYLNNDYSIAVINGQRISKRKYINQLETMYGKQVADTLIEEELVKQLGKENEVKIEKEKIDEAYKDIEDRIGGKEALEEALLLNNLTEAELKSQLENELILKSIVEPTLQYTEEDLAKFFEEYKEFIYEDTTTISFEEKRDEIEDYYVEQKVYEQKDTILAEYKQDATIQINLPGEGDEGRYGIFKATRNLIRNFAERKNTN
jgi:parvulin-like peptidyl-prolyl isomerase